MSGVLKKRGSKPAGSASGLADLSTETTELEFHRKVMQQIGAMNAEIAAASTKIDECEDEVETAELAYESAKQRLKEAKSERDGAERTLLRFLNPAGGEIHPLFDQMQAPDEDLHGKGCSKWRQEPISALRLSLSAVQALTGQDILFVGQLQDRVMAKSHSWWEEVTGLNASVAAAIVDRLNDFILERTK